MTKEEMQKLAALVVGTVKDSGADTMECVTVLAFALRFAVDDLEAGRGR